MNFRSALLGSCAIVGMMVGCGDAREILAPPGPTLAATEASHAVGGLSDHPLSYVTTDKGDYQPGDRVSVRGAGFYPGEEVRLVFDETPALRETRTLTVNADRNGRIRSNEYEIQEYHRGQAFTLTAYGEASGLSAKEFFTDHHEVDFVVPNPRPAGLGGTVIVVGKFFPFFPCFGGFPVQPEYTIRLSRAGLPDAVASDGRVGTFEDRFAVLFEVPGRPAGIDNVTVRESIDCPHEEVHTEGGATLVWRTPNQPPVADAGPDQVVTRDNPAGAFVTLHGSLTDPDDLIHSVRWFEGSLEIAHVPNPTVFLALGTHTIQLRVSDGEAVDSDVMEVRVINSPPRADPGTAVRTEACTSGGAIVALDGSASSDVDGEIVSYEWVDETGRVFQTGPTASLALPLGTHHLSLQVTDNDGAVGTFAFTVTVEDKTAPTVALSLTRQNLWPPNHEMVNVATSISASDVCDGAPRITDLTVSSNEPVDGTGDGHTSPDWTVVRAANGAFEVWLRAERAGSGNGRVYTLRAVGVDASGNTGVGVASVLVAHDRSKK